MLFHALNMAHYGLRQRKRAADNRGHMERAYPENLHFHMCYDGLDGVLWYNLNANPIAAGRSVAPGVNVAAGL